MRHLYLLLLALGLSMGHSLHALNDSLHSNNDNTKKRYIGFNSRPVASFTEVNAD
jgi:uncharacterized metal-binding protein